MMLPNVLYSVIFDFLRFDHVDEYLICLNFCGNSYLNRRLGFACKPYSVKEFLQLINKLQPNIHIEQQLYFFSSLLQMVGKVHFKHFIERLPVWYQEGKHGRISVKDFVIERKSDNVFSLIPRDNSLKIFDNFLQERTQALRIYSKLIGNYYLASIAFCMQKYCDEYPVVYVFCIDGNQNNAIEDWVFDLCPLKKDLPKHPLKSAAFFNIFMELLKIVYE